MNVGNGLVERRKEDDRGGRQTRESVRSVINKSVLYMFMKLSSNNQFEFLKINPTWRFLKKLKLELPYDPNISLLGIYPKEQKSAHNKESYTPMFTATQLKIAKLCDCHTMIYKENVLYLYTGVLFGYN